MTTELITFEIGAHAIKKMYEFAQCHYVSGGEWYNELFIAIIDPNFDGKCVLMKGNDAMYCELYHEKEEDNPYDPNLFTDLGFSVTHGDRDYGKLNKPTSEEDLETHKIYIKALEDKVDDLEKVLHEYHITNVSGMEK